MNNYFELLGVSEDASDEDIKKQYRLLSKKYHPDINPEGAEKFRNSLKTCIQMDQSSTQKEKLLTKL